MNMRDVEAMVERATPLLRASRGRVLTPADFAAAGLSLDEAKTVCAALRFRRDLATVDLEVVLDGQQTGHIIGMDFTADPRDTAPDIMTWQDPRLRFIWRVTPT